MLRVETFHTETDMGAAEEFRCIDMQGLMFTLGLGGGGWFRLHVASTFRLVPRVQCIFSEEYHTQKIVLPLSFD